MDKNRIELEKFAKEKKIVEVDYLATCCGISLKERGEIANINDYYVIIKDKEGNQNKIFIDSITEIQELKK
jgi:hypothetical protein